jgi:hypothetical protein
MLYLGSAPLLPFLLVISSPSVGAPEAGTPEWWVVVLGRMFRTGEVRPVAVTLLIGFVAGIFLIGRGFWRAFGRFKFTVGRLMIAVMVVAFGLASAPLGFLMAMLAPVLLTINVLRKPAGVPGERFHDARS